MKFLNDLNAKTLRSVLHYDPETGAWNWLVSRGTRKKGSPAGCNNGDKYRRICIFGVHYLSSRLAFLHMTGEWPPFEIDHCDGNRANDKWSNLRPASDTENQGNKSCRKDSHTHVKGIRKGYISKRHGQRYVARIQHNGKRLFLGYFSSIEEAKAAHDAAAQHLFGTFARP